jgi:sugar phosphate isomerase/epimerase
MSMKGGIESYRYHRFFGDVYPEQKKPPRSMTLEDFLKRAHDLKVDGVSLESCFIPRFDKEYLSELKGRLDEYGMDRVFAWGHPDGLVDNLKLARILKDAGYQGFLAVEIDFLHPDYKDEDRAVARSVRELKRIARKLK